MSRDISISIAKGIGICLMVVGHAKMPYIVDFIYMFHMPLFFVLSGYCFKEKYLNDFRQFTLRRINGLYFPFLKWGLFFLILHNVLFNLNIYNDQYGYAGNVSHLYSLNEFIRHGVIGCGLFLYSEQILGGYWFLVQLFWASLIGFGVIYLIRRPIIGATILLVICFLIKYLINQTIPYTGIGSITILSASFFTYGYALRKMELKINYPIIVGCFLIVVVGSFLWNTTMQDFTYKQTFFYALTAILGAVMIVGISKVISEKFVGDLKHIKKFLIIAGDNSLIILTWHFLSFKLVSLLVILIEGHPIEMLAMFPVIDNVNIVYTILYVIVGIGVPLISFALYERFINCIKVQN